MSLHGNRIYAFLPGLEIPIYKRPCTVCRLQLSLWGPRSCTHRGSEARVGNLMDNMNLAHDLMYLHVEKFFNFKFLRLSPRVSRMVKRVCKIEPWKRSETIFSSSNLKKKKKKTNQSNISKEFSFTRLS